jgi:hypothetical protein
MHCTLPCEQCLIIRFAIFVGEEPDSGDDDAEGGVSAASDGAVGADIRRQGERPPSDEQQDRQRWIPRLPSWLERSFDQK